MSMETDEIIDPVSTVHDCIARLRRKRFEHNTLDLTRRVRDAQKQKHGKSLDEFLEQKNQDLLRKKQDFLQKK